MMPGDWEFALRLVVAAVLGGIVGIERERLERPAGFKTHVLVSLGSALFMLVSYYVADLYRVGGEVRFDPARIGAQVVTGIGFLGAGTIIRQGSLVKGLTTAASLWMISAVGLAVGAGFYWAAIAGVIIVRLLFWIKLESFMRIHHHVGLIVVYESPVQLPAITGVLVDAGIQTTDIEAVTDAGGKSTLTARIVRPASGLDEGTLVAAIEKIEGVEDVRVEHP
jgi:putative Mg2+ transporter-C (MgtC) family protein